MLESILAHDTGDGRRGYFSVICRDISDLKRVENLKDALISTVSHELRTPLTTVHGSLRLLASGVAGKVDDEALEVLQLALKSTDRLDHLINNFLYLDAIESGRIDVGCQSLELGDLVQGAIRVTCESTPATPAHFEYDKPRSPLWALANPAHLRNVLFNLFSNAAKFSIPGSAVVVSLFGDEQTARIEIADRGPGITRKFGNQVFQKFARADSSDSRGSEGTGLGLSIAWALVIRMGGDIGFRAREGGGTIFWVELKR